MRGTFYTYVIAFFLISFSILSACSEKKDLVDAYLKIKNVSTLLVKPGDEVEVQFESNLNHEQIVVKLGNNLINYSELGNDYIKFIVPRDFENGTYDLTLSIGDKISIYNETIMVVDVDENYQCNEKVPLKDASVVVKCFLSSNKSGIHPRLFYDTSKIEEIKTIIKQDPNFAGKMYEKIIQQADKLVNEPLKEWGLDGANLRIDAIHKIGNEDFPYLSLAYLFTHESKYAKRCYEQMEAMCKWKDWGAGRHFLDTGIGARGFAMAYDAIYDYLSVDQRKLLADGLIKYALKPGIEQIETGKGQAWAWYNSNDNWNGICNGGLICGALAIFEENIELSSRLIALASNKLVNYINSFEPEGASEEGMMYWSYGLSNTFMALEAMKCNLTTTYGLTTDFSGFKKTGWFPYLMSGPVGTASIGDDYIYNGKENLFRSYFWFAYNYNDANLAKTHYESCMRTGKGMNDYFDLLFYSPKLVSQGDLESKPLSGYVKGIDYMYLSEGNDENSLYVGMHGGDNAASHGHLDAGSFLLQVDGENLFIGNLGKPDPYPADYFNVTNPKYSDAPTNVANEPGRFYYYRVRTEGKSCLVVNPDARPEQDPEGKATLFSFGNDNYIIDLTDCYKRDVSSYKRGLKLDRDNKCIIIQDEFELKNTNNNVYWIAHTPKANFFELSDDNRSVRYFENGKEVFIKLLAPDNVSFQVVKPNLNEANYLDITKGIFQIMDGKNPINKWYGKLQINMNNIGKGKHNIVVQISRENRKMLFDSLDAWNL